MKPEIAIIVAKAKDHGIGCSDKLPWNISEELQYFKKHTMGKPVIMGRKTFQSITTQYKKPLDGRKNIVVSRSGYKDSNYPEVEFCSSLEEAIGKGLMEAEKTNQKEIFVIGGSEIFKQAIPMANRIYLTRIDANSPLEATAFLEDKYFSDWKVVEEKTKIETYKEKISQVDVDCEFQVLERLEN